MPITTQAHLPCPNCGAPAHVTTEWPDQTDGTPARAEITDYTCPNNCAVNEEALRQITGISEDN